MPAPLLSISIALHCKWIMSTAQGHKYSASSSQNVKAQLANAYNELGKELSSTKIKVVGNYTLGKVIGEGVHTRPDSL